MNRTITRAFDVLTYVSNNEQGVSLKEIMIFTKMPKSSTFDIIQTLLGIRLIEVSKYNEKKYVLGLQTFMLGKKYTASKNLVEASSQYLNPLADTLSRTGFVGVLDGTNIVYVHKYMGKNARLATCNIGTRHELYSTALGKALLAFLDEPEKMRVIDEIHMAQITVNTISSKEELIKNMDGVKKNGYSVDNKENEVHMMCYGAPIFDYTGKVIAAISLSDMKDPDLSDEQIGDKIKNAAYEISRELGYSGVKF